MGQEIERKFLVYHEKWQSMDKPAGDHYRQGYLLTDPQKTIRVGITDTKVFLTIKGLSVGATRAEYEIPIQEAGELLDKFAISELSKIRYKIPYKGKFWEIDQFLGDNEGLVVAEIELKSEDEHFDIPEWADRQVTGEEKYYNSNLTIHLYKDWV
jgi:CYTH domain-containing protein